MYAAAIGAFRQAYEKASLVALEPIMKVVAEYSMEFLRYGKVPQSIQEDLRQKYLKKREEGR